MAVETVGDVLRALPLRTCPKMRVLILRRHSGRNGVSKDAPGGTGDIWTILRDGPAGLLRRRARIFGQVHKMKAQFSSGSSDESIFCSDGDLTKLRL
jgi:hypothetical protein